jgi:hypothetical protein
MAIPALIIPAVIEAGIKVIERIFPDPNEAAKAKLELFKLQQEGTLAELASETTIAEKQAEINIAESSSASLFRNGWRPAVGWICALGLSYQFIARPTMNFILAIAGYNVEMGPLELETLMTLLFGMLGLGWYRTTEKLRGVA